tara:strand:- start:1253 stop:1453 length:201 start_codon:yes stop_codon:yes gene_type:complete
MANYTGLEDRLIKAGSPRSVSNGNVPTTANQAPGILPINNTFSKGKYLDYVLDSGVTVGVASDITG